MQPCSPNAVVVAGAAAVVIGAGLLWHRYRHRMLAPPPLVYELKGDYYQLLGHAWDHEVKDFKVIYRPLYHCPAAADRFEAHVLAASHFSRWDEKFRLLTPEEVAELPREVRSLLLPGPFWFDPKWTASGLTTPVPLMETADAGGQMQTRRHPRTRSGFGRRSHELPLLEHVIGDYRGFISAVHARLVRAGCDARARGYQMDHICYRVESLRQYRRTLDALVPALGELLVESMIGGRPIAIVALHTPIVHEGFEIRCIELPCPKHGSPYARGLEHAELVVCDAAAGVEGSDGLRTWLERCRAEAPCGEGIGALLAQMEPFSRENQPAMNKAVNADVSIVLHASGPGANVAAVDGVAAADGAAPAPDDADGGPTKLCVKFHQRPLCQVVAWELAHGHVVAVPSGYFEGEAA